MTFREDGFFVDGGGGGGCDLEEEGEVTDLDGTDL